MKLGDFSSLAIDYRKYRPDYSLVVLQALRKIVSAQDRPVRVVDVGAGTGIWTKMLAETGLNCTAVEPNDSMRNEGIEFTRGLSIEWRSGSAESTGLQDQSADWVCMASSFHWADTQQALKEFKRILTPGGFLTVLWNPRNIEGHVLHERVEQIIYDYLPNMKRVSSGSSKHSRDFSKELVSTGEFGNVLFMEAPHQIEMSRERYLGAWRSVNDIRAQAGSGRFAEILHKIEEIVAPYESIVVPYKTRAWTVQSI